MSFPKVLVVGQPFDKVTGGGITLSNLFRGWDPDKIAAICTGHYYHQLDFSICDNFFLLGQNEYKWAFPFNLLQKNIKSGVVKYRNDEQNLCEIKNLASLRKSLYHHLFYPILNFTGLTHSISRLALSEELVHWITDYNPDVIYAQAASREAVLFCKELHNFVKKPLIFHMMDDWPSIIGGNGIFKHYWQKTIDFELRSLLKDASLVMSISDEMADEYKKRYDIEFVTFHNPVDISFWKKHQKNDYEMSSNPTIMYAGRIGTSIQKSLETVAKAVELININFGLNLKFILQTKDKPLWADKYECVSYQPLSSYYTLPKIFSRADILIMPYDFSKKSVKFIQFSMPTKASEYMISGTPVIVFAPKQTAIVKSAIKYQWGKVITDDDVSTLAKEIKSYVIDKEMRKKFAETAKKLAEKNHNSIDITTKFRDLIFSLAQKFA